MDQHSIALSRIESRVHDGASAGVTYFGHAEQNGEAA